MHIQTSEMARPIKETTKATQTIILDEVDFRKLKVHQILNKE